MNSIITGCKGTSITGGTAIYSEKDLYLSGNVVIKDNTLASDTTTADQANLMTIESKGNVYDSGLTEGSYIGAIHVDSTKKYGAFAEGIVVNTLGSNTARAASYFVCDQPGYAKKIENTNQLAFRRHQHIWNYEANQNVITATCAENSVGASCGVGSQTLTLDASDCDKTYDGNPITGATATPSAGWTTANGLTVPDIYYKGTNGTSYESTTSVPTDAGTYQASITVGDATATDEFEITKKKVTIPMADDTTFAYNGSAQTYTLGNTGDSSFYTVTGSTQTTAGSHTVTVALNDTTNTCWSDDTTDAKKFDFVIGQADSAAPSAIENLTYNGNEQAFVTASPSAGSTIYYRVDGGDWSTTIPERKNVKRTDAGEVAAYKVEYYVDGGTNYKSVGSSDAPAGSFDVTITPKTLSTAMVTLSLTEPVYDGSAKTQAVTVSDSVSGTELISADDYTISDNLTQTEVGEYTVVVKGQKNYMGEVTPTWKIKGRDFADGDIEATDYTGSYDGQEHGISVKAAAGKSFTEFKVLYSDSQNGTYSEDSPANKKKDAGTYEVWYKVTAKGHNATNPAKLTIKINKADAVVTPAANQSKKFGDSDPAYTFTATGLAEGETEANLGLTLKRTAGETVGTYDYAIDTCTTGNYNVTLASDAPKFQITGKPLEDPEITAAFKNSDIYVYDGNERDVTDDVVIKNGENVLIKGTDYELSGDVKKTSFGTYELIFEGKGNYTGKKKLSWKITDPNPPSGEIAFDETTKWDAFLNTITFDLFKGKDQKITITAADGEGERSGSTSGC